MSTHTLIEVTIKDGDCFKTYLAYREGAFSKEMLEEQATLRYKHDSTNASDIDRNVAIHGIHCIKVRAESLSQSAANRLKKSFIEVYRTEGWNILNKRHPKDFCKKR